MTRWDSLTLVGFACLIAGAWLYGGLRLALAIAGVGCFSLGLWGVRSAALRQERERLERLHEQLRKEPR